MSYHDEEELDRLWRDAEDEVLPTADEITEMKLELDAEEKESLDRN